MPRKVTAAGTPRRTTTPAAPGLPLLEGWGNVLFVWRSQATITAQSAARFEEIGDRFVTRLGAEGFSDWQQVDTPACAGFVTAVCKSGSPPRPPTQHLRRSTVRAIFRTLRAEGWVSGDPTLDLRLPPREPRVYRPLTDDEVVLCRTSSRLGRTGSGTLLRAVAWALGEATAATSEIGAVRLGDLDNPERPRWVRFDASSRHHGRQGMLSRWGSQVVGRHATMLAAAGGDEHTLLAYGGSGPAGQYLAQASVCTGLTKILDLAGLRDDPAVCARSLRGWAGRRMHRAGVPIEQVAVRLGCSSLDAAAAEIGLSWMPSTPG